ncbi:MAG: hypothetical protein ACLTFB_02605 [Candidatus Phytoplasma pyri]|uniref:hypothetical protein n=1 Tax=Candidatus Phytoplasma pyri TaxID=47566 RepID=UPI0039833964
MQENKIITTNKNKNYTEIKLAQEVLLSMLEKKIQSHCQKYRQLLKLHPKILCDDFYEDLILDHLTAENNFFEALLTIMNSHDVGWYEFKMVGRTPVVPTKIQAIVENFQLQHPYLTFNITNLSELNSTMTASSSQMEIYFTVNFPITHKYTLPQVLCALYTVLAQNNLLATQWDNHSDIFKSLIIT